MFSLVSGLRAIPIVRLPRAVEGLQTPYRAISPMIRLAAAIALPPLHTL